MQVYSKFANREDIETQSVKSVGKSSNRYIRSHSTKRSVKTIEITPKSKSIYDSKPQANLTHEELDLQNALKLLYEVCTNKMKHLIYIFRKFDR